MQNTENENSRLWNQLKASDGNNIADGLQEYHKDNLIEEFLKVYEVDIDNPEFIEIVNEFFDLLLEKGYSFEMMMECTKQWRLFKDKYGNNLAAFKRLKFTDIFHEKPFRLYNRKWFVDQEKVLEDKEYEALQKMFKYVKTTDQSIYYSWYELPSLPQNFVKWKDYDWKPKAELPEPKIELNQQLNELASENFDLKSKLEKAEMKIQEKQKRIMTLENNNKVYQNRIIELETKYQSLADSLELEL